MKKTKIISFYTDKEKEEFIKAKNAELSEICSDLTEDKKQLTKPLICEISFMFAILKDLKEIIKCYGTVEYYQNGEHQKGLKSSAALDSYNKTIKSYQSAYKQLTDLLPKNEAPPSDGFDEF